MSVWTWVVVAVVWALAGGVAWKTARAGGPAPSARLAARCSVGAVGTWGRGGPADGGGVGMPAEAVSVDELDALLEAAGKRGFLWHLFGGDRHGPRVLAGVLEWPGCADVVVLHGVDRAHAYRVPTGSGSDVFTPGEVFWWYGEGPVWTLRSLLTLPEPGHPDAPGTLVPAPPGSGVPGDRVPVRLRRRGLSPWSPGA